MVLNYFNKSYDLITQKINIKATQNYRFSYAYIDFMFLPQPNYIIFGGRKKNKGMSTLDSEGKNQILVSIARCAFSGKMVIQFSFLFKASVNIK